MNDLRNNVLTIAVLSPHKGCNVMEKILQPNQFKFIFLNHSNEIINQKIDFLIIDYRHNLKELSSETKYQTIVLTDTQKSPASILALSGQLSTFGQNEKHQFVPSYLIDFVVGISLSILIQQMKKGSFQKKENKIIVSLIDLVHYFGAFNISAKQNGFLQNPLGKNLLDGGTPFYRLYSCKEGIIAVGNLQPKFYQDMIKCLKFDHQTESYLLKNQFNIEKWSKITQLLSEKFMKKSASQWEKILSAYDTCVTQVSQKINQVQNIQPHIYSLRKSKL